MTSPTICVPNQWTPECHYTSDPRYYELVAEDVKKVCGIGQENDTDELEKKLIKCSLDNIERHRFRFARSLLAAVIKHTSNPAIRKGARLVNSWVTQEAHLSAAPFWDSLLYSVGFQIELSQNYKNDPNLMGIDAYFPYKEIFEFSE